MAGRSSSDEDISGWLTPRRAIEILDAVFHGSDLSKRELLQRLRGGMVRAICHHTSIDGRQLQTGALNQLGSEDWNNIFSTNEVWLTGTHSGGTYRDERAYKPSLPIQFFDVRFNPDDINAIVAPHATSGPNAAAPNQAEDKPEAYDLDADYRKLPAVSEAHLNAWFEFYKAVHSPAEDTEERAVEFARQCFPRKSVSRERIRALRGNVKRGPKPRGI